MSIKLNPLCKRYQVYQGSVIEQMPKLVAAGYSPISIASIMEIRIQYKRELPDWTRYGFMTGDAIAYHPDGRVKVILDSDLAKGISPDSTLTSHDALLLHEKEFDYLRGYEFKIDDLRKYTSRKQRLEDINNNPIWKILARDPTLLEDYINFLHSYEDKKQQFEGVCLEMELPGDYPRLRCLAVSSLDGVVWSYINGTTSLNAANTLVGTLDAQPITCSFS